ncbi:hypothetical protein KI387_021236, partial [Taxus chinensis]
GWIKRRASALRGNCHGEEGGDCERGKKMWQGRSSRGGWFGGSVAAQRGAGTGGGACGERERPGRGTEECGGGSAWGPWGVWRGACGEGSAQGAGGGRGADDLGPGQRPSSSRGTVGW